MEFGILYLESQCFPRLRLGETLRFSGNKMNCFPLDKSLSVYCCIPSLSLNKTSTVIGWFLVNSILVARSGCFAAIVDGKV